METSSKSGADISLPCLLKFKKVSLHGSIPPNSCLGQFIDLFTLKGDPSDSAVEDGGLRPLDCSDCLFESRRGHG
jgi:hypothetical protein